MTNTSPTPRVTWGCVCVCDARTPTPRPDNPTGHCYQVLALRPAATRQKESTHSAKGSLPLHPTSCLPSTPPHQPHQHDDGHQQQQQQHAAFLGQQYSASCPCAISVPSTTTRRRSPGGDGVPQAARRGGEGVLLRRRGPARRAEARYVCVRSLTCACAGIGLRHGCSFLMALLPPSATRESGLPQSLHPEAPLFLPNSFRPPGHSLRADHG